MGDNEQARAAQELMTRIIRIIFQFGFNDSVNKSMMKYIHGVDMGPVRCPISTISEDKLAKIHADLEAIQFKAKCTF